jgi:hypothetical protein
MVVKDDEDDNRENAGGGEGMDNLIDDASFDRNPFIIAKNIWEKFKDLKNLGNIKENVAKNDWNEVTGKDPSEPLFSKSDLIRVRTADCNIAFNSYGDGHEDTGRDSHVAESFTQGEKNTQEIILFDQ